MKRFPLFYLLLLSLGLSAQQKKIRFEHYDFRQGLSNQIVNCVFQDHQGFLWIGTDFGLNRFDGINFTTWFNNSSQPNSLVHDKILSIAEDQQHRLWIGTQEGISCFDPYALKFINYSDAGKGIYHFVKKNCHVLADSNNNIWIGHSRGVSILNPQRTSFLEIPLALQAPGRQLNNYVKNIIENPDWIWASTSYGLYRFDKKNYNYRHFLLPPKENAPVNYNALTSLCLDKEGNIWCGSWVSGVVWLSKNAHQLQHQFINTKEERAIGYAMAVQATEEKGSQLFAGTYLGLAKINVEEFLKNTDHVSSLYGPDINDPFSVSGDVRCLMPDRSGNTWIGTSSGLYKIDPYATSFQSYQYSTLAGNAFEPLAICKAENENYWILTGRSLLLFDPVKGDFQLPSFSVTKYQPFDLVGTQTGYWLTSNSGLVQLNPSMQLIKTYDSLSVPGLPMQHLRKIYADRQGRLWIATRRQGMIIMDTRDKRFTHKFHTASEDINFTGWEVEDILQDHENNIWIGAGNGLFRYDPIQDKAQKIPLCEVVESNNDCEGVSCVFQASDKKIYIGTRLGFYCFDFNTGKASSVQLQHPGISRNILYISEDDRRRLWLVTNNGLVCFDPATANTRLYSLKNGLPDNELACLYKMGRSFITGIQGSLVLFDPGEVYTNIAIPSPVFSSVYVDDTVVVNHLDHSNPVLRYNQSIAFDFVSLNYINASQIQYSYMLKGLEENWRSLGNTHTLRFSNLPSGDYSLLVRATGGDGSWDGSYKQFVFVVNPPFWKTWWFIALTIATIGIAIYFFYRYRLQQAIRLERLRTRIATDLHDDIGATLSSISMYSEAVKKQVKEKLPHLEPVLDKMGENSRDMVATMSDIVWTINPDNDKGIKLVDRMEAHAKDMSGVKNVQVYFNADPQINNLILSLEYRKNIYLIFKEAVNNSLKYSDARHIWLELGLKNNWLQLMIKDDGKGFIPTLESSGNGLKNMQARAVEIDGKIDVESAIGVGTTITLSCKIT